jgi:hypothetical protein
MSVTIEAYTHAVEPLSPITSAMDYYRLKCSSCSLLNVVYRKQAIDVCVTALFYSGRCSNVGRYVSQHMQPKSKSLSRYARFISMRWSVLPLESSQANYAFMHNGCRSCADADCKRAMFSIWVFQRQAPCVMGLTVSKLRPHSRSDKAEDVMSIPTRPKTRKRPMRAQRWQISRHNPASRQLYSAHRIPRHTRREADPWRRLELLVDADVGDLISAAVDNGHGRPLRPP